MKILIVASTLSFGGAERAASTLSLALSQVYDVAVLTFHGHQTYPYGGRLYDLNYLYAPEAKLLRKLYKLWVKLRGFRQFVREFCPDVVLSFTEGPNIIVILNKLLGLKCPVVINCQIPPLLIYQGIYRWIYSALIRVLYPRAEVVVALSEGVRSQLIQNFGLKSQLVFTINNPVDVDEVQRLGQIQSASFPLDVHAPFILAVGRFASQKNHALLLKAFDRIATQTSAHLILIGQGDLENDLKRQVEIYHLEQRVHFLGWQDNPFAYMRRADLLALTSNYEGLGNVLIEAMACGCPVISTDCPYGPREILADGQYGILVPVGDDQALAAAMIHLLNNSQTRATFSERGRQRAAEFDSALIARRYQGLIEHLSLPK